MFKAFAVKEDKMVAFLTTNQKLCGVPPNVIAQVKPNHAKTIQHPQRVCSAAPAGPADVPSLERRAGRPDHCRRHLGEDARTRHLRHPDRQRLATMSRMSASAGRVADATGNWVDPSAPGG